MTTVKTLIRFTSIAVAVALTIAQIVPTATVDLPADSVAAKHTTAQLAADISFGLERGSRLDGIPFPDIAGGRPLANAWIPVTQSINPLTSSSHLVLRLSPVEKHERLRN